MDKTMIPYNAETLTLMNCAACGHEGAPRVRAYTSCLEVSCSRCGDETNMDRKSGPKARPPIAAPWDA